MINYVFATITASVLAYATAMDIDETTNDGLATDNLPSFGDANEPEPANVEELEPEPIEEEPAPMAAAAAEAVPIAEAQLAPQPEKSSSIFGGKRHARKIKKTIRNAQNNKKRKQTRNKNQKS
jgi:hypothetical protein